MQKIQKFVDIFVCCLYFSSHFYFFRLVDLSIFISTKIQKDEKYTLLVIHLSEWPEKLSGICQNITN